MIKTMEGIKVIDFDLAAAGPFVGEMLRNCGADCTLVEPIIAFTLDAVFDIAVRSGLHCAPDAHRTFKTFEQGGTVRVSPGYYTKQEELETFITSLSELCFGM